LELNPDSHRGSEWVHVKILEAKLAMEKDPNWLAKHSVLGTGVHFSSATSGMFSKYASEIEYQLHERIPFTPFPDKLIANVFNEWGDLLATQRSVEHANIAYQLSLVNDKTDPYGVQSKMDSLKVIFTKRKIKVPDWTGYYIDRNGNPVSEESFTQTNVKRPAAYIRGGNTKATNKTMIYILAIACTLLVGYLAVYLYRQRLRNR
jgi:hypothetical protein